MTKAITSLLFLFATSGFAGTYTFSVINSATIVPGVTDVGNHCDDCTTAIALPFTWSLYGAPYTAALVSSNGNIQFTGSSTAYSNAALPDTGFGATIFQYWDDQMTTNPGEGIFTSTSGSPGSQIFNIEYRTHYFSGGGTANYEVRLYEGQSRFDMIYGTMNTHSSDTIGVQNATHDDVTQYTFNGAGGSFGDNMTLTTGDIGSVPEPGTGMLAVFGGAVALLSRRFRRRNQ